MKTLRKHKLLGALVAAGTIVAATTAVVAEDEGMELVQRQAVMNSIGAHMGGIKAGLAAGNAEAVEAHANAINRLAPVITTFFLKGSDKGKTRAKPEIWQKWDEFVGASKALADESGKLVQVAKGGDSAAMAAQFGEMGKKGCGGCHKPFRVPKK